MRTIRTGINRILNGFFRAQWGSNGASYCTYPVILIVVHAIILTVTDLRSIKDTANLFINCGAQHLRNMTSIRVIIRRNVIQFFPGHSIRGYGLS